MIYLLLRLFLVFSLLAALLPVPVWAQSSKENIEKARDIFMAGQKAFQKGNLDEALKKFRHANRLVPTAETSYNIGHIYERKGDFENN